MVKGSVLPASKSLNLASLVLGVTLALLCLDVPRHRIGRHRVIYE